MSNVKIYAEITVKKIKFLSIEHGFRNIKLSIIEDVPLKSMEVELSPEEAKALAEDLLKRAEEIISNS